jgi:hypothetical protein
MTEQIITEPRVAFGMKAKNGVRKYKARITIVPEIDDFG